MVVTVILHLGSLVSLEIKRITNYSILGNLYRPRHKFVINWLLDKAATSCTATLALVEEKREMAITHGMI